MGPGYCHPEHLSLLFIIVISIPIWHLWNPVSPGLPLSMFQSLAIRTPFIVDCHGVWNSRDLIFLITSLKGISKLSYSEIQA